MNNNHEKELKNFYEYFPKDFFPYTRQRYEKIKDFSNSIKLVREDKGIRVSIIDLVIVNNGIYILTKTEGLAPEYEGREGRLYPFEVFDDNGWYYQKDSSESSGISPIELFIINVPLLPDSGFLNIKISSIDIYSKKRSLYNAGEAELMRLDLSEEEIKKKIEELNAEFENMPGPPMEPEPIAEDTVEGSWEFKIDLQDLIREDFKVTRQKIDEYLEFEDGKLHVKEMIKFPEGTAFVSSKQTELQEKIVEHNGQFYYQKGVRLFTLNVNNYDTLLIPRIIRRDFNGEKEVLFYFDYKRKFIYRKTAVINPDDVTPDGLTFQNIIFNGPDRTSGVLSDSTDVGNELSD